LALPERVWINVHGRYFYTSSKVAEKEIQIGLEVPNWHLKLVTAVIFDVLIILKTWKYRGDLSLGQSRLTPISQLLRLDPKFATLLPLGVALKFSN
jgi:hypothetical protein